MFEFRGGVEVDLKAGGGKTEDGGGGGQQQQGQHHTFLQHDQTQCHETLDYASKVVKVISMLNIALICAVYIYRMLVDQYLV